MPSFWNCNAALGLRQRWQPPTTAASHWPLRMACRAWSRARRLEEQAVSMAWLGPATMKEKVKVKVKLEVYSLVSSAKRYSLDFTQLPPGHVHRICSFISHLNSLGSIQPGCHFLRTELFKHTSLHRPTRYPLTPGSRECTCEQSALPRSTTSKHIQRSRGSKPRSLACKSRTVPLSHDAPWRILKITLKQDERRKFDALQNLGDKVTGGSYRDFHSTT